MCEDPVKKAHRIHDEVMKPLYLQKRFAELEERVAEIIEVEPDLGVKRELMSLLATLLNRSETKERSFVWRKD